MTAKSKPAPLPPADFVKAVLDRMAAEALAKQNPFHDVPFADNPLPVIPPTPAERGADVLCDTIPPTEPPAIPETTPPRPHDVVRWHIYPPRVTVEQFADLAGARAHVAALSPVVFWKWAIRTPNPWPHTIDTGQVSDPEGLRDLPPPPLPEAAE
jgi:hypothetical protein